jgi:hypothetical protein
MGEASSDGVAATLAIVVSLVGAAGRAPSEGSTVAVADGAAAAVAAGRPFSASLCAAPELHATSGAARHSVVKQRTPMAAS